VTPLALTPKRRRVRLRGCPGLVQRWRRTRAHRGACRLCGPRAAWSHAPVLRNARVEENRMVRRSHLILAKAMRPQGMWAVW